MLYYDAALQKTADYYVFGMEMAERNLSVLGRGYRYGFNGKENDKELGDGMRLVQDYGFRLYNPAIGKFLSVDPLTSEYPWNSVYAFAENDVIRSIDLEGAEKLIVTQYLWNIDGSQTKLHSGVAKSNGSWSGDKYVDAYFFRQNSGQVVYYLPGEDGLSGRSIQAMRNANPHYFEALRVYKEKENEKKLNIARDCVGIAGGALTIYLSFGLLTPIVAGTAAASGTTMAAGGFGLASGTFAVGAGGAKLGLDIQGKNDEAQRVPTSPIGGLGIIIDKLRGGKDLTYQNIGDIVSTVISLASNGPDALFKNWDALSTADKGLAFRDITNGLLGLTITPKTLKYEKDFVKIMDEYSKLIKEDAKK